MWRPPDEDRVLLMAGQTTQYAIEPRGEYVFGIVTGRAMRSRRGAERRLVRPGQLVAWDPFRGTRRHGRRSPTMDRPADGRRSRRPRCLGRRWRNRPTDRRVLPGSGDRRLRARRQVPAAAPRAAVVYHPPGMRPPTRRMAERPESSAPGRPSTTSAAQWTRRQGAARLPSTTSANSLNATSASRSSRTPPESASSASSGCSAHAPACHPTPSKSPTASVPPAACSKRARRSPQTAAATGFADQSHLHRHLRRSLGVTPAEYRRRFSA